jgi:hypothetical protein
MNFGKSPSTTLLSPGQQNSQMNYHHHHYHHQNTNNNPHQLHKIQNTNNKKYLQISSSLSQLPKQQMNSAKRNSVLSANNSNFNSSSPNKLALDETNNSSFVGIPMVEEVIIQPDNGSQDDLLDQRKNAHVAFYERNSNSRPMTATDGIGFPNTMPSFDDPQANQVILKVKKSIEINFCTFS